VPLPKLRLLGKALEHAEVKHGGALVTSWLIEDDFATAGADESHTEGIIDTLRTVRGATVVVLGRQRPGGAGPETKVSLRCTDGTVDVAAIAALRGGGGHKQAAGFTAAGDVFDVLEWTERQLQSLL
jgi:phosphoesterase RecJ-like protein